MPEPADVSIKPLTPERFAELQALAGKDPAPGLVAYRDGRAIGWVSLAPREDYERLAYSKVLAPVDEARVWSIVCFAVSRLARGQGVAAALLSGAIEYALDHGATTLEAYPVDTSGGRVSAASAYQGTLTMFERAGFTVVERRQWNASTPAPPDRPARPGGRAERHAKRTGKLKRVG